MLVFAVVLIVAPVAMPKPAHAIVGGEAVVAAWAELIEVVSDVWGSIMAVETVTKAVEGQASMVIAEQQAASADATNAAVADSAAVAAVAQQAPGQDRVCNASIIYRAGEHMTRFRDLVMGMGTAIYTRGESPGEASGTGTSYLVDYIRRKCYDYIPTGGKNYPMSCRFDAVPCEDNRNKPGLNKEQKQEAEQEYAACRQAQFDFVDIQSKWTSDPYSSMEFPVPITFKLKDLYTLEEVCGAKPTADEPTENKKTYNDCAEDYDKRGDQDVQVIAPDKPRTDEDYGGMTQEEKTLQQAADDKGYNSSAYDQMKWMAAWDTCFNTAGPRPAPPSVKDMSPQGVAKRSQYDICRMKESVFVGQCVRLMANMTRPQCANTDDEKITALCLIMNQACSAAAALGVEIPEEMNDCKKGLSYYQLKQLEYLNCLSEDAQILSFQGGGVAGQEQQAVATCTRIQQGVDKQVTEDLRAYQSALGGLSEMGSCWAKYYSIK